MASVRNLILIVVVSSGAAAQPRISPRLEKWGASSYVVVFRQGADMAQARERLRSRGLDLIDHPDLRPRDVLAAGPRTPLAEIGEWPEVEYVLAASPALVARQRVIACSGPRVINGAAAEYVEVGRGWSRPPGGLAEISYFFESVTPKLDEGAARVEIERALREWEKHANLKLKAGSEAGSPRTISIKFATGVHGDTYPFDGPGASLAHTFYPAPPNPEPIAGNMHLDSTENWRIGENVDLYSAALHEAGHALGLGHSDQPGAVMYPYYHQAYGLTADDIAGIQALYGAREEAAPPAPPAAPPDPPPTPPVEPPPSAPSGPQPSNSDKTPPTLKISTPSRTNLSTTAGNLAMAGAAADNKGVVAVKWSASTGQSGEAFGTTNWTADIPLYVGTTVITVRAFDAMGNSSWRAVTVTRR